MSLPNIERQMRKGVIELCVLTILKKQEAYPSEIIEQLKAKDFQLLEGTLYPLLTRLKNAQLIDYRWEESENGPPRKYFSVTQQGIQFYETLRTSWEALIQSVDKILNQ